MNSRVDRGSGLVCFIGAFCVVTVCVATEVDGWQHFGLFFSSFSCCFRCGCVNIFCARCEVTKRKREAEGHLMNLSFCCFEFSFHRLLCPSYLLHHVVRS